MANEKNKKVEQIRTFFKKNQPKNHPITDHPISECEEYVRGLYFDMLCVMAQYENDDTENQLRFIERIMAACEESMSIAEHIKRAMEINADKVTEFLKQCEDNDLDEIFIIDSLLIVCANGAPNKKQVEFIAEIGDVMGFDKEDMDWLTKLAVSILEQDSDKYLEANSSYDPDYEESFLEALTCYTKEYVSGCLISTSTHCYIYSKEIGTEPLDGGNRIWFDLDELIIENQVLTNFTFKNIRTVIIRNCKIEDVGLTFNAVNKIIIEDCCFNIRGETKGDRYCNRAIEFYTTNCTATISDCSFNGCRCYVNYDSSYSYPVYGGAIYIADNRNRSNNNIISILGCDFRDINIHSGRSREYAKGVILWSFDSSDSILIKDSYFSGCTSGNNGGLFSINVKLENNTYVGCASAR